MYYFMEWPLFSAMCSFILEARGRPRAHTVNITVTCSSSVFRENNTATKRAVCPFRAAVETW